VRSIIVTPEVVRALAALKLPREVLLALLNRLRADLPGNEAQFRADRDPADPDTLFRYTHGIEVEGRWRLFVFSICDSISPDHFFVEGVVST
jgi:hypothetical protein